MVCKKRLSASAKRAKEKREENKRIAKMADELRDLLAEFGAHLSGFDPGVSAYLPGEARGVGYCGENLDFNYSEWKWLKPLLEELRDARKSRNT